MRKIESQMNAAIAAKTDWRKANTSVSYNPETETSSVTLHGNKIAEVTTNTSQTRIKLFDGGWQTNTTKSRLNAILDAFGLPNERVYQHRWEWFVRMRDNTSIPFFSTMVLQ